MPEFPVENKSERDIRFQRNEDYWRNTPVGRDFELIANSSTSNRPRIPDAKNSATCYDFLELTLHAVSYLWKRPIGCIAIEQMRLPSRSSLRSATLKCISSKKLVS